MRRFKTSCVLILTILSAAVTAGPLRADDLNQLRTDVREATPSSPAPARSPPARDDYSQSNGGNNFSSGPGDDDWIDPQWTTALVMGAVVVASAPIWGPVKLTNDDYSSAAYFPRYPYQRPLEGHLMIEPDVPRRPREWFGRVFFDFRTDFDDLNVWGGGLQLDTTSRFGIDASAHYYSQTLPSGAHDQLVMGSGDVLFRFAQSEWLEMRTGVGINWLSDSVRSDLGVNFTYGGDWFPIRPFVVSGDLDFGKLGHASLFHARLTAGIQWKLAELYIGLDYLDIGKTQFNTGIAGVRFSF